MAVTANQSLVFRWLLGVPIESSFLVKDAEEIYTWTAVGLDYSGYLVNWVKDSGYLFVGFAVERKTGDVSNGVRCRVVRIGTIERLPISGGIPNVGTDIYATDNYTFVANRSATPAAVALTGTATFASSTHVVGSGTAFKSELRPGEKVYNSDDDATIDAVMVDYIESDTSLYLTSAYGGTTGAGKAIKVLKNADAPIGRVIYKHSDTSVDVEFNTIMATNSGLPDTFLLTGGNLSLSGTLSVTGNTSLGGTLAVTGASTLTGNASLGGTLAVTGASTLSGATEIADELTLTDKETLTNASTTVDPNKPVSLLNANGGAISASLADGNTGQIKLLTMIDATNAAAITVTNFYGTNNTLNFNALSDSALLYFDGIKWALISNNGLTIS